MHFYNGLSAAKRIGISYKTLLRYIEKGRIIPEDGKTPTGQLVISEDQVEQLRLEVQHERTMFRQSQAAISRNRQSETDRDSLPLTDTTLTETVKQLGKLVARVDVHQARIEELERRIAELESKQAAEKPEKLYRFQVDAQEAKAQQGPRNRLSSPNSDIPSHLPPGTITSTEFRNRLGIEKPEMDSYIQRGVYGEKLPTTKIPHPTRAGYNLTYFTPEQAEQAINILKKYGKTREVSD